MGPDFREGLSVMEMKKLYHRSIRTVSIWDLGKCPILREGVPYSESPLSEVTHTHLMKYQQSVETQSPSGSCSPDVRGAWPSPPSRPVPRPRR